MIPDQMENSPALAVNPFAAADVAAILRERGWAAGELSAEQVAWCEHAAGILARVESHVVLSRYAARDVLRQLALLLLEGAALDSDRFKEIIAALKEGLDIRGRELFHPIRLALAGRAG